MKGRGGGVDEGVKFGITFEDRQEDLYRWWYLILS